MASKKYVYFFHPGKAEGKSAMKNLLGGKGANLAEMCNLSIPVPSGFTLSTEACVYYFRNGDRWPTGLDKELKSNMARLEKAMGKKFGDPADPLLVSVRSGARASMPGMMDTVLNLGLNDTTLKAMITRTGNPRFVYDSYRRFIQMFSSVVLGLDSSLFEKELTALKKRMRAKQDTDLDAAALKKLAETFKAIASKQTGKPFPQSPNKQLEMAINAVFGSWNNKRAKKYRSLYNIPEDWGTAVNVQAMVFGNSGEDSGTGVAFTRNPSTGENKLFGEFLINAQGEDVVAGIRTPLSIDGMANAFPKAAADLKRIALRLDNHYRDMLDLEFTVQDKKLYMLQARVGKRTAAAAVRIAVELAKSKKITRKEAVLRVQPSQLDQLLHKTIDPKARVDAIGNGLPASPGAAVGRVVFSSEEATEMAERGEPALLVRYETSPEDLAGMSASEGILTVHGGMTSHAAVVARGMGKCCIAGAGCVEIDEKSRRLKTGGKEVKAGDWLTLDGSTGRVILGKAELSTPSLSGDFGTLMKWADELRRLDVRANADTPEDAQVARGFGAKGIGLCRTEHMFFAPDRILAVRQMIIADNEKQRARALKKLLPMQREDFKGILKAMQGLPVTIRLLDPPLHEFLPKTASAIQAVAREIGISAAEVKKRVEMLSESNPMLGHRGCRLGITFMPIYEMQVRAIYEATAALKKKKIDARPEVMIPLVGTSKELEICREMALRIGKEVQKASGVKLKLEIGTMIELPRAALVADQIAEHADFFSFGTNDLTQTALGLSRDDSGSFLPHYVEQGIFSVDPFTSIDEEGVGVLIKWAVKKGRGAKPGLKTGICGEHGGDPQSILFCHKVGLNYVSCSPFRVPIARLAAAHAAVEAPKHASTD